MEDALKRIVELEIDCIESVEDEDFFIRASKKLMNLAKHIGGDEGVREVDREIKLYYKNLIKEKQHD